MKPINKLKLAIFASIFSAGSQIACAVDEPQPGLELQTSELQKIQQTSVFQEEFSKEVTDATLETFGKILKVLDLPTPEEQIEPKVAAYFILWSLSHDVLYKDFEGAFLPEILAPIFEENCIKVRLNGKDESLEKKFFEFLISNEKLKLAFMREFSISELEFSVYRHGKPCNYYIFRSVKQKGKVLLDSLIYKGKVLLDSLIKIRIQDDDINYEDKLSQSFFFAFCNLCNEKNDERLEMLKEEVKKLDFDKLVYLRGFINLNKKFIQDKYKDQLLAYIDELHTDPC